MTDRFLSSLPATIGNDDALPDVTMTTLKTTTEKQYQDFAEVKIAVLIDRIYIPVVVTVGLPGNVLCFLTLVFSSLRTTSTCVYMAAIAVLDSVILILDLCVLVRGYVGHTQFYFANDYACGFHNFLFYFSIHFDVLLLLAMTIDRYIVVKFPLKAQTLCTSRSALKAIAVVGTFSFALNVHIFFTRRMGDSGNAEDPLKCWYPDPEVDYFMKKIYTWIDASIYSFIPFLSLLVLNALIIKQLKVSRSFNRQFTKSGDGIKVSRVKTETEENTVNSEIETSNTYIDSRDEFSDRAMGSCESVPDVAQKSIPMERKNPGNIFTISRKRESRKPSSKSVKKKMGTNASITVMLLLVSFTFLLLTSPVVIVLLYKRYYWLPSTSAERAQARLTHAVVDNLMYTNHAVNFLLYCISGSRFRRELKRLLAGMCWCRRSSPVKTH